LHSYRHQFGWELASRQRPQKPLHHRLKAYQSGCSTKPAHRSWRWAN
jgi:hypothetical protein